MIYQYKPGAKQEEKQEELVRSFALGNDRIIIDYSIHDDGNKR